MTIAYTQGAKRRIKHRNDVLCLAYELRVGDKVQEALDG